jgi:hypothetical protein
LQSYFGRSFAARRLDNLDCTHCALAAGRTSADVDAGKPKQDLLPRFGLLFRIVTITTGQKLSAPVQLFLSASVSQKSVVSDFDEPIRQHMKQESPDELSGIHRHDLAFVVIGVIPPPERDLVVFKLHDPVIADRDPVGVSAEILKNALGSVEGRLGVDDPLLFKQVGDQAIESRRLCKMAYGAGI